MENKDNSNTKIIYCQANSEHTWKVCINSLENPHYLMKEELYPYLDSLTTDREMLQTFTYLIQRFFSFVYDVEENVLYELHKEDGDELLSDLKNRFEEVEMKNDKKSEFGLKMVSPDTARNFREKMMEFVKKMKKM
jgi:hypothetical protein